MKNMFVKSVKRVCLSFLIIALLFTGVASAGQAFTSLEAYAASDVKAKVKKSTKKIRTYSVSFGWRNEQVTASFKVKLKDPKKLYSIGEATLTLSGKNQTLSVPPTVRQKVRYKIGRKWYIKNITFKLKKITTTKDFQPMQWIDLSKAKLGDYYQSNINIPIFQPIRYNGALYCLHYYEYWEHINGDNWVDEIFGNEVAYHWVRKCVLAGTVSKSDAKHLDKYDKQAVKAVLKFWQANKGATPIEYAKAAFQYVHDIPYGWYYGSPEAGPES
ncbi:MAG: hypothetical protein LBL08_02400, partial [Candidatus Nomurabacteria bacterium]|nr:hypothetical protein [Candidatus Nomurabacteria bacterium]